MFNIERKFGFASILLQVQRRFIRLTGFLTNIHTKRGFSCVRISPMTGLEPELPDQKTFKEIASMCT